MTAEEDYDNLSIRDLTRLFAELAFQHRTLQSNQAALQREINGLRRSLIERQQGEQVDRVRTRPRYQVQTTIPSHFVVPTTEERNESSRTTTRRRITIGDRVTVRNPNRGQGNIGVVTSFTRSGFARVRLLGTAQTIRRFPFNLERIVVAEEVTTEQVETEEENEPPRGQVLQQ